jgi:hypothetical protein
VGRGREMDDAARDDVKLWGVRCSDGLILWVDNEQAAQRVLTSLVGADLIVRRADPGAPPLDGSTLCGMPEPPAD